MADQNIQPHRITKPIQLLAAWLVGLVLVNGSFLAAANLIQEPTWVPPLLVIAAVLNVPVFIVAVFFLQTKFRPEMQEDEYYARYLEKCFSEDTRRTELVIANPADEFSASKCRLELLNSQMKQLEPAGAKMEAPTTPKGLSSQVPKVRIQINDLLPDYKPLLDALLKQNFRPEFTFGSNSVDPKVPIPFVITFGPGVTKDIAQKLITICRPFGLQGLGLTSAHDRPMHIGKVYVGSYGFEYPFRPFLKLDADTFKRISSPEISDMEFWSLIPIPPS